MREDIRPNVDRVNSTGLPWNDITRILQILAPAVFIAAVLAALSTLERPEPWALVGADVLFYVAWLCLVFSLVELYSEYARQTRAVCFVALGVLGIALIPTFTGRVANGLQQRGRESQAPANDEALRKKARVEVTNLHKTYAHLSEAWQHYEIRIRPRCPVCASALILASKMIEADSADLETLPSLDRDARGVTLEQWNASNAREANARFGFASNTLEAEIHQAGLPDQTAFAKALTDGGSGIATNAENLALLAIRAGIGTPK